MKKHIDQFVTNATVSRRSCAALLSMLFVLSSSVFCHAQIRKPRIDETIKANVYANNSFKLYINGEFIAVDSMAFVPHNVVSVDVLPLIR